MTITGFTGWSATAILNVDLNGIVLDGAVMTANQIDDGFREMMAQLKANVGTSAQIWANTTGKHLTTDQAWGAGAEVTLTDAATIAVDMGTFLNAKVTLAGNRTLGQPSNTKVGQAGLIRIIQDGTGSRTLAYHADWKFVGAAAPVLSTVAGTVDYLFYQVAAANSIFGTLLRAVA